MWSTHNSGILFLMLGAAACGSDATGPTPPNQPEVLISGTLDVPGTYLADLETGTIVNDDSSDLWDDALDTDDIVLNIRNGSRLALMGTSQPSYDNCKGANFSETPVQLFGMTVPQYFCFTTNEGRIARVKLTKAPVQGSYGITIEFTTWKKSS